METPNASKYSDQQISILENMAELRISDEVKKNLRMKTEGTLFSLGKIHILIEDQRFEMFILTDGIKREYYEIKNEQDFSKLFKRALAAVLINSL